MKNYKEVLYLMKLHISDLTFVSNNVLGKDLAQQMFFFTYSFWWEGGSKMINFVQFCHYHNFEIEQKLTEERNRENMYRNGEMQSSLIIQIVLSVLSSTEMLYLIN